MIVDLCNDVSNLLLSLGVANVGKLADVLERVGRPGSTELFDLSDHKAETVKVLRNFRSVGHLLEVLGKERVDEFAVLELLMYGGVVLGRWVQDCLIHEEVEFVLTRVIFLALVHLVTKDVILKESDALSFNVLEKSWVVSFGTLEFTNCFRHEAEVTELLNG